MYDMKHLAKLAKHEELAPDAWNAFKALDVAALAEGAVSVKNKELIAVAVAHTTQCPYCIEIHVKNARKEGATDEEIAETIFVAAALRAGAAVVRCTHFFRALTV